MGSLANTVFTMMLGWVRSAVSSIWSMFSSSDGNSLFAWIGEHWVKIVIVLCIVGTAADIVVHLFRWRPLTVWASFFRRLRRHHDEDTSSYEEEEHPRKKRAARKAQRQLIYADGNTETVDVDDWQDDAPETANDFDEEPYPAYAEPSPEVANMAHTQYRREDYASRTPVGLEDYPQARRTPVQTEELPPEPISREVVREPQTNTRRSSKMLKRMADLPKTIWQAEDDDELQLRYQPAKPTVDKDEAYHAPVYPPSWKDHTNSTTQQ